MTDAPLTMTVSAAERRLLTTLRDIPESPLRDRVQRLLDELVTFVRYPRCQWMQGDGVPCGTVDRDCEQCAHLLTLLEQMSDRMAVK